MANLKQYGLERFYIDVLVSDAARVVWKSGDLFDAIITDRKCYVYRHYNALYAVFYL